MVIGRTISIEELKELAKSLGVENQVHFLGFRTDIKELLVAADVFLFTTLQEGLPRSMMEAMASGLPCIVSKIRGNVDLMENGTGGYLCGSTDVDAFAKSIAELTEDANLRKKMSEYNLERIKDFDVSVVEEEMLNKISYIADYEGRSVNSQVLVLIRENIKAFEDANGAIDGKITPDSNVKPTRK